MSFISYHKELRRLVFTKRLISLLPEKAQHRVAKKLYDYQSNNVQGIDMNVHYLHENVACLVNTKDLIGWNIFFFGAYEKNTNALLKQYVKHDDVVLEAGANIGSETILLSMLAGGVQYMLLNRAPMSSSVLPATSC